MAIVIAKNTYFRYCRRNKIYVGEEFSEIMQDSMQDTSPGSTGSDRAG